MECPKCEGVLSFVPANQNWWCNACLDSHAGPAPEGMAGPTAEEIATERERGNAHGASSNGDFWQAFGLLELIPFLALLGGIGLIATGSWLYGSLVIAATVLVGFSAILFW